MQVNNSCTIMSTMKNLFVEVIKARWHGANSYIAQSRCAGKKTLDVGCGFGDFLRYEPENFIGVDINEEALTFCKKEGYQVQMGSVDHLPFPDKTFERVIALQVIEHLEPALAYAMFSEVARVLSQGGEFIFSTEMPTKRVWDTFSHVKPYSPKSIYKMITDKENHHGQETFKKMTDLSIVGIYYNGIFFRNSLLNAFSQTISNLTPWNKYNYTMILRKLT